MSQDHLGVLWFATQDGLNRYDGQFYEKFNEYFDDITKPKFSRLGKIFVDQDDQIWMITKGGRLKRYSPVDFQMLEVNSVQQAACIIQDRQGMLIVGTWNNGIYKINPESGSVVSHFTQGDAVLSDSIHTIIQDAENIYWIGSSSGLYYSKDIGLQFKKAVYEKSFENTSISSIVMDKNGTLWAGSFEKGLFYKKSNEGILQSYKPNTEVQNGSLLNSINILNLIVDHRNRLWIATYGTGLFLLDDSRLHNFTLQKNNPNSISYNDILCLYEDSNHVIWCGTDGGGVNFYDENLHKFNSYTNADVPENIHVDVIRSIIKDSDDVIWLGTSGYGLTKFDPNGEVKWQTINSNNSGLSNDRIMCLNEDAQKRIWIGTQGNGLDIYNSDTQSFANYFNDKKKAYLPDHTIWTIFHDSKNRHWIGTRDHGLCLFDETKGVIKQYTPSNSGISDFSIRMILEENEDIFWIGTEGQGICRLDMNTEKFELIQAGEESSINHLSSNLIKSLYLDNEYLWVGTGGGGLNVININNRNTKVYKTSDGLPNNVIYTILPDNSNNLWLSTNRGISKFTPSANPTNPESDAAIINYDNYDGLQGLEFNTGAYFKDENGFLYFGGINGYNWFKPENIVLNKKSSRAIINQIEVNGAPIKSDTIISRVSILELPHNENAISFSFSTLNFTMPQRNSYKYMLSGYDEEWISPGFRSFVNYTNLPPGGYTFSVLGGNYDGVFHDLSTDIQIIIHPPWWKTTWAYVFGSLLLILSGLWIYMFQRNRWKLKMQLELEHQEAERFKELDQFKTRLYTNITHEFRTPLTVVLGLVEKSREYFSSRNPAQFHDATDIIQRNANRLLNLVNQMLDLSKVESKSIELRMIHGDIISFLKNLLAMYDTYASNSNLKLIFETTISELFMDYDSDNMQKIITNLISNSIKFTDSGEIKLSVKTLMPGAKEPGAKEIVEIKVSDTGIGIAERNLPHIFNRFYQVEHEDQQSTIGSGIGMALVKELVEVLDGNISIDSKLGEGTEVTIQLPVTHYAEIMEDAAKQQPLSLNEPIESPKISSVSVEETGNPIVLLIEDNPDVLYYLSTCLHEHYRLIQAKNGIEGISKAIDYVPDLIISDVMMPGKTGYEVCETLKRDTRTSHIPIILLTAKAELKDKISGIKYGADAYLIKPFNVDELQAQLENLLRSRALLIGKFRDHQSVTAGIEYPEKENEFLIRLNELIKDELGNPELNVDKVCDQLYMSRTQLHRKIKALTDKSITAYIRSYRLTEAMKLIKQTSNTIQQIAFETGFSDASYFHRSFVKEFSKKPTDLRK